MSRICSSLREELRCRNFLMHDYPRPSHFAKSHWDKKKFAQYAYVIYKALISIDLFIWCVWSGVDPSSGNIKWFIYLTDWAFLFLTLYFVWSTGTAVHRLYLTSRDQSIDVEGPPLPWYYRVQWVLQNVAFCIALMVTVLYWSLVYDPAYGIPLEVDVNMHTLNSVFAIVDLFLGEAPIRLLHFYQPVVLGTVYIIFSVIYWKAGGTGIGNSTFIYPILDYGHRPGEAAIVVVLTGLLVIPLTHSIIFGFYKLRKFLAGRCYADREAGEYRTLVTKTEDANEHDLAVM